MRAAGHFRLLHGFLLRLSAAATAAAAAGQFVSVPALPTRDPLRVLLQPIQGFARGEFRAAALVPADGLPLLLGGGGDVLAGGADLAVVGLLLVVGVVLDVPAQASGLPDRRAPDPQVKPSQAQVKRRHVHPTRARAICLFT